MQQCLPVDQVRHGFQARPIVAKTTPSAHSLPVQTSQAYAVIMAGGSGTRFWPASRKGHPKQLLSLVQNHHVDNPGADRPSGPSDAPQPAPTAAETLIGATVRRLRALVDPSNILIVTTEALREATQQAIPDIPSENILGEPAGRNTAPCLGWACQHILRRDPEATVAALPADQHVVDEAAFVHTLRAAFEATQHKRIVVVGAKPTRPDTGYGYIEVGDSLEAATTVEISETNTSPGPRAPREVQRFVEKPNLEKAKTYLETGNYLWNTGMFFFRASNMVASIGEHLPQLAQQLIPLATVPPEEEQACIQQIYDQVTPVSIDHGVIEKETSLAVIPSEFGWSDLGTWTTAWELSEKDTAQNNRRPRTVHLDSRGNHISADPQKWVAMVGVTDLVVVDTPDALLIIPREQSQKVRDVVDALKEQESKSL